MGDSTTTRPAALASGTLAKTPFLHLLVYLLDKKHSGTLELFANDKRSASILFLDGLPAKTRTSEPIAHLGRVLQDIGHLTEEQLTQSLAELAKAKAARPVLHGQILVAQGLIDEAKLRGGLREQLERKLHHVAAMPADTKYAYYDGFDGLRGWGGDGDGIDPIPLLWGMLLEYAPWDHVQAALGGVGLAPLRLSRGAVLDRLRLSKEERTAVDLLRVRPLRMADLAKLGRLNERTAQLLVYLLLVTKQVEMLSPAEAAAAMSPSTQSMPAAGSDPRIKRALTPTPQQRASASVPKKTPFPGIPMQKATPFPGIPVQKATPFPGIPVQQQTTPMPPSARGSPSPMPSSGPRTSSTSGQYAKAVVPPANLPRELAERWGEIVERSSTIDRADYFMMLDIARDATTNDVEAAFFALAKRWHPDRLPPELNAVRDACSRVFARMSEAHATLIDEEQREQYMRLLADGSGSPETQATVAKVLEAAKNFQKAEVCLRRNDFPQAELFCRKALEDDTTQPDYLAMLAWLIALKEENQTPERTIESIQMLERAISMNEMCEKAFFWRGMLFKRIGKNEQAVKDFRRAFDLNPRNIDAGREVRLYHMRGGRRSSKPPANKRSTPSPPKPDDSVKPGIFGRLFKKP
ncbi:MAG TPA: DnaJ domain-containing protein [Polyangiaceae bacterium]|jgi:tetratricopeptide (TPR) repeat protein